MDPKDRAELDRLLDLAEKEQLLAPQAPRLTDAMFNEMREQNARRIAEMERAAAAVRGRRQQLAPDSEWLED